jgi:hypothetical protein
MVEEDARSIVLAVLRKPAGWNRAMISRTLPRVSLVALVAVLVLTALLLVLFVRTRPSQRGDSAASTGLSATASTGVKQKISLTDVHPHFIPTGGLASSAARSDGDVPGVPSEPRPAAARDVELIENADHALEREDYPSALRAAQECLSLDPGDRECFRRELMVYGRTGDFENERVLVEECLYDDPQDTECLEGAVVVNARAKDLVSARAHAELLRQLAPDTTLSFIADGTVADYSGDRASAIASYEHACSLGQEFCCFRAEALRNGRPLYGP